MPLAVDAEGDVVQTTSSSSYLVLGFVIFIVFLLIALFVFWFWFRRCHKKSKCKTACKKKKRCDSCHKDPCECSDSESSSC